MGRDGAVEPFDLSLYPGEIVGLAGCWGRGRSELARLLVGADRPDRGELSLDERPVKLPTPLAALRRHLAMSSEDRKKEGIIGDLTVRENIALALQAGRGPWRRIPRRELDEIVQKYIVVLNINPPNPNALIRNLSGGNQQKVLLARWLATAPRLLVLDDPPAASTSAPRRRSSGSSPTSPPTACPSSSSPPSWRRCCGSASASSSCADRHKVAEITNDASVTTDTVLEAIANSEVRAS